MSHYFWWEVCRHSEALSQPSVSLHVSLVLCLTLALCRLLWASRRLGAAKLRSTWEAKRVFVLLGCDYLSSHLRHLLVQVQRPSQVFLRQVCGQLRGYVRFLKRWLSLCELNLPHCHSVDLIDFHRHVKSLACDQFLPTLNVRRLPSFIHARLCAYLMCL